MRVLVTVGSTKFDALVGAALSQPVLDALTQKGYTHIVIQCGNSQVDELGSRDVEWNRLGQGPNIDVWKFKPSLDEEYDAADLVIGHAGLYYSFFLFFNTALDPWGLSRLGYHPRCTAKGQTPHNCTQSNPPRQSPGRYGSCYGVIGTCKNIDGQVSAELYPYGFSSVQHEIYSSDLAQSIMDLDTSSLVSFPPFDGSEFRRLIDREMGF